jgi:hypothetical protein
VSADIPCQQIGAKLRPMTNPFAATIASWPPHIRAQFQEIRTLILAAAQGAAVGPISESLKWGQPAWRPKRARQGSTLRLMWQENTPASLALFVDCKTSLSATMEEIYPTEFIYENNRALRLPDSRHPPTLWRCPADGL